MRSVTERLGVRSAAATPVIGFACLQFDLCRFTGGDNGSVHGSCPPYRVACSATIAEPSRYYPSCARGREKPLAFANSRAVQTGTAVTDISQSMVSRGKGLDQVDAAFLRTTGSEGFLCTTEGFSPDPDVSVMDFPSVSGRVSGRVPESDLRRRTALSSTRRQ